MVALILQRGGDPNAPGVREEIGTALQEASSEGHVGIVKLLLANGADPDEVEATTALGRASRKGHAQIVELLIENRAPVNGWNPEDPWNIPAIHEAAAGGHIDIIKILLDKEADLHLQGSSHGSALHVAAGHGHENAVRVLLENGANIHCTQDDEKETALAAASAGGRFDVVRTFLEHGAVMDDHNSSSRLLAGLSAALPTALEPMLWGYEATKELLLNVLSRPTTTLWGYYEHRQNMLQDTATKGDEGVVSRLLEKGIFKKRRETLPSTCKRIDIRLYRDRPITLDHGADANNRNQDGQLPLSCTTASGSEDAVHVLLQAGAQINAQSRPGNPFGSLNLSGDTAIFVAAYHGKTEVLQLLVRNVGDPNLETECRDGSFALLAASIQCHKDAVRLLLDNGANIDAQSIIIGTAR